MLSADKVLEFAENGALESNVSAHTRQGDPETFIVYRDLYNDNARRRR